MTTARTTLVRRLTRPAVRGALALAAGVGIVLTPAVASAAPASAATLAAPSTAGQTAVNTAMAHLGAPYVWAGAGPTSFDCSGLTQFAWKAAGVSLPHSTGAQAAMGTPVDRAHLRPGDLVFFYGNSHVGIYIGNNQVVHAPTTGDVVKVTGIDAFHGFSGARHIG